jgi:hypothetical protein
VTDPSPYMHCPNCLAEYRAGFTICTNCGSLLVPGPSPAQEPTPEPERRIGRLDVVDVAPDRDEPPDRFELEARPVVLTSIVEEDAPAFLAALEEEEIGARAGSRTEDGGVEIVVHAAKLIDAQAVLVEFTGDVGLVEEIGFRSGDDEGAEASELAVVATARPQDVGAMATRLRDVGIDVRLELSEAAGAPGTTSSAAILVPIEELERARRVLGIER